MKPDEALHVLGVPPGSSPEEIRRAYSRQTRAWNPAGDPDGLRRLREAYDLLLGNPSSQPSPRPSPASEQPPPLPRSFTAPTGASELPPPLPPGGYREARRIPLLNVEPDRPESSPLLRVLALCGGGLVVLIVLWIGVSGLQDSNTAEVPRSPVHPDVVPSSPPAFAGYATAQEGMSEVCPRIRTDFCKAAQAILQATAQHKCSDARAIRKTIEEPARYLDPELDKGRNPRTRALRDKLDEEIARCWKFWNP